MGSFIDGALQEAFSEAAFWPSTAAPLDRMHHAASLLANDLGGLWRHLKDPQSLSVRDNLHGANAPADSGEFYIFLGKGKTSPDYLVEMSPKPGGLNFLLTDTRNPAAMQVIAMSDNTRDIARAFVRECVRHGLVKTDTPAPRR